MKRIFLYIAMVLQLPLFSQQVKIPPAVIFVHGLGGDESRWDKVIKNLDPGKFIYVSNYNIEEVSQGYNVTEVRMVDQASFTSNSIIPIFTIKYEDNQNLSFMEQGQRLRDVVDDVRSFTANREVILFGHSMGGLASRACIMLNSEGIGGLVTAGTPHAGSFLAYLPAFQKDLNKLKLIPLSKLLDITGLFIGINISSKAVSMLAPDSPEMREMYMQRIPVDLPVVCIVSKWDLLEKYLSDEIKSPVESINEFLSLYKSEKPIPVDIMDIEIQRKFSDGVVSVPSQYIKTGIANPAEIMPDVFETDKNHLDIPDDTKCMLQALYLIIEKSSGLKISDDSSKETTLGFIIDSSGSMQDSDPNDVRKSAVERIVDLLSGNENFFIVDFDGNSSWLNPNEWYNWDKENIKDYIRRIDSNGNTNVGLGISTMRQALESSLSEYKNSAVILLSDGKGPYKNEAEWFANHGIKIYTISYKNKADANILNNIASQTGGIYIQANDESDVIAAFIQFHNDLLGLNKFISYRGNLNRSSSAEIPAFFVDIKTNMITAILSWSGIRKAFTLVSPSGIRYRYAPYSSSIFDLQNAEYYVHNHLNVINQFMSGPSYQEPEEYLFTDIVPAADWKSGPGYLMVSISNPEPGKWTASVNTEGNQTSSDPFLFEANGSGGVNLPLETNSTGGIYRFDIVNNYSEINLLTSKAEIKLQTPTGKKSDISSSYKAGKFQFYPFDGIGNYQISANVLFNDGINNTYQRQYNRSILVGELLPGYLAPVKELMGLYVITDQGSITGNREGIRCIIYGQGQTSAEKKASGYVTHVNERECTIRIVDNRGGKIEVGDIVELDLLQWQKDN